MPPNVIDVPKAKLLWEQQDILKSLQKANPECLITTKNFRCSVTGIIDVDPNNPMFKTTVHEKFNDMLDTLYNRSYNLYEYDHSYKRWDIDIFNGTYKKVRSN